MRVDAEAVGRRVRALREAAGWNQLELAEAAGVSRQAVGALEAGRHLPRVDAAVGLAAALGTTVEHLLRHDPPRAVSILGAALTEGQPVRAARVGERVVCTPLPSVTDGEFWQAPDAVVRRGLVECFDGASLDAFVVMGCDPALGVLAGLSTSGAGRLLTVASSSRAARTALEDGRAHAALVHDVDPARSGHPAGARRLRLAAWRTGLAAAQGSAAAVARALAGEGPVVQREEGAGAQAAYRRALASRDVALPHGPLARGHLDAGHRALESGLAAVTIEPAAAALGLDFHALEIHRVELWIAAGALEHAGAAALGELVVSARFRDRVRRFAGYELDVAA